MYWGGKKQDYWYYLLNKSGHMEKINLYHNYKSMCMCAYLSTNYTRLGAAAAALRTGLSRAKHCQWVDNVKVQSCRN